MIRFADLESKEAGKLMTGLFAKAWVAAHDEADPGTDFEAFADAFATHLDALASALPWDVVQDEIKEAKGRAEIFSENFVIGVAKSQVDPAVTASGAVSSDLVPTVVALRYALTTGIPLNNEVVDVYTRLIDANKVTKDNIWLTREYILGADEGQKPVTIGIWDSGTDVSVFEGQLWINPSETLDGQDSDSNAFVDDINGIAYDKEGNKSPFLMHPMGDMAGRVDEAMNYTKGFMDLTSSIDSEEATELKKHLGSIEPDKVNDFIEELGFAALYMHGTHVAGIAVEDNPFARIMVARLSFDYHNPPTPLTVASAKRIAESFKRTVRYFRIVRCSGGQHELGLVAQGDRVHARGQRRRRDSRGAGEADPGTLRHPLGRSARRHARGEEHPLRHGGRKLGQRCRVRSDDPVEFRSSQPPRRRGRRPGRGSDRFHEPGEKRPSLRQRVRGRELCPGWRSHGDVGNLHVSPRRWSTLRRRSSPWSRT